MIAPATARWYQASIRPFVPLLIPVASVASAGSDVRLPSGDPVLQRALPADFAAFIADLCDRANWDATLATPDFAYRRSDELPPWAANAPEWLKPVTHLRDADLSQLLSVLADLAPDDPHMAELDAWAGRLTVRQAVAYTGGTLLTVTAAGVDKGSALLALCEAMGVDPADAIAIGDSDVDVPMFEVVGHSVAMANASDAVKAAATTVTASADEDGVAKALKAAL